METNANKTRVVLADDHVLVRAGIKLLLERMPGVEVVAEAGDGRTALELIQKHRPDIALLDIAMSGLNGLEVSARATKEMPGLKVIMLSMYSAEEYVVQALRSGAVGYLVKEAATTELELALTAIKRGENYLSPAIARSVVERIIQQGDTERPLDQLTPRQREILQLIAEGKNTKEIGYILNISPKTVETHRAQLMDRLNIRDVPGLVRFAIRSGMVHPET